MSKVFRGKVQIFVKSLEAKFSSKIFGQLDKCLRSLCRKFGLVKSEKRACTTIIENTALNIRIAQLFLYFWSFSCAGHVRSWKMRRIKRPAEWCFALSHGWSLSYKGFSNILVPVIVEDSDIYNKGAFHQTVRF